MIVHAGPPPPGGWAFANQMTYWQSHPFAWCVDFDRQRATKDGIYFEVEAMVKKPHNSRRYELLKRDALEAILEEAKYCLFFRDLIWRGFYPASRVNLEHAIERIPELLKSTNNRFRVST